MGGNTDLYGRESAPAGSKPQGPCRGESRHIGRGCRGGGRLSPPNSTPDRLRSTVDSPRSSKQRGTTEWWSWSAQVLLDDPGAIRDAHLAFFAAGARVAISASYQASIAGFGRLGLDRDQRPR